MAVALTADGRRALSGSEDNTLKVWDVVAGDPVAAFFGEGGITHVQLAADRRTMVAGDASGAVHSLRLENAD
jgi:WD40 repeat protein